MITGKLDHPRPFGRFLLVAKIASGGMATVFRAEVPQGDPLHGKPLAIKMLHDHLSENEEFIRMFKDEGRIVRDFDHPNVVKVYEVGETDGAHYLAMEFIDGRDLAQLLVAHRMNQQVMAGPPTYEILRQALNAMRYVHGWKGKNGRLAGVVHRDISPQNVLISRSGQVKITDFGIARGDHRSDRTRTGTVKGKMHYMAPEQAAGHRVDARADLYSMGAVAFEMLAGQPLFGPGTTEVLQARAVRGTIDYGPKFERLPEDTKAWLKKALATHVDDRFQSADAMLAAMEQIHKASQNLYRSEQLLRLLELPEASRSKQRAARLLEVDNAAHAGRLAAGAVLSSGTPSRPSILLPRGHVELDGTSRDSRLRNAVADQPLDWTGAADLSLKPVTGVREQRETKEPREHRKHRSELLPAETAVGKSYQPLPGAARPVRAKEAAAAGVDVLDPGSFARPSENAATADTPGAKAVRGENGARPAKGAAQRVSRILPESQGLALASFVAWSCGALVLFAVLMEVTGVEVKLPEVTDESLAALFDDDAPKTRTDAVAMSKPATHRAIGFPVQAPPLRGVDAAAVPAVAAVAVAPVKRPDPQARARAEAAAERSVAANAEREAWAGRPLERVARPGDDGAVDPEAAGAHAGAGKADKAMRAPVKAAEIVVAAKAKADLNLEAAPVVAGSPAPAVKLGRSLPPAARAEAVVLHAQIVPMPVKAKAVVAAQPVKVGQVAVKAGPAAVKATPVSVKVGPVAAKATPVSVKVGPVAAKAPVAAVKHDAAAPANKPVATGVKVVAPAKKPVASAAKVTAPANKPVASGAKVPAPAKKPVASGTKVTAPAKKPIVPATKVKVAVKAAAAPGKKAATAVGPAKKVTAPGKAPVAAAKKPGVAGKVAPAPVKPNAAPRPVAKRAAGVDNHVQR